VVELVIGAEAVFAVEHQKRNTGRRHLTALEGPPQLPAHRDHVMVAVRGIDGAEDEALGGAARRVAFASMPARPCRSAVALRKVASSAHSSASCRRRAPTSPSFQNET